MQKIQITVLVDNTVNRDGLLAEHGLSFWMEADGFSVLFDCGQGPALVHNANELGIKLAAADAVVISHGHYDHSGGLLQLMEQNTDATIYMHPSAVIERFSIHGALVKNIGMPAQVFEKLGRRGNGVVFNKSAQEIHPGFHLTGEIPCTNAIENTGGSFFLDPDGKTPDPIIDDQALWIETEQGLVVVLGCSHSGVVNTLDYISTLSGGAPVNTLIGGMHLKNASSERLAYTADTIDRYRIQHLYPGHCTGTAAAMYLRKAMSERVDCIGACKTYASAGFRIQVSGMHKVL